MANVQLPVTNEPDQKVVFTLDGVSYAFRFRYNERGGSWNFDMLDDSGSEIISGRKVTVSWPLFGWRETDSRLPGGRLLACDTTDSDTDPTLEDFGSRVVLEYIEAADIV
jgi:hypothetical protein